MGCLRPVNRWYMFTNLLTNDRESIVEPSQTSEQLGSIKVVKLRGITSPLKHHRKKKTMVLPKTSSFYFRPLKFGWCVKGDINICKFQCKKVDNFCWIHVTPKPLPTLPLKGKQNMRPNLYSHVWDIVYQLALTCMKLGCVSSPK